MILETMFKVAKNDNLFQRNSQYSNLTNPMMWLLIFFKFQKAIIPLNMSKIAEK